MEIVIYVGLVLFGLVLGSFAGATVWRLRARQLVADKKAGEHVDHAEYTKLKKLANEKFMANAKPEILASEQKKQADALAKIKTIEESLSLL